MYYNRKRQLSNVQYLCISNINTTRYLQPRGPLQLVYAVSQNDILKMESLVNA
jgi:hypothetical protein